MAGVGWTGVMVQKSNKRRYFCLSDTEVGEVGFNNIRFNNIRILMLTFETLGFLCYYAQNYSIMDLKRNGLKYVWTYT